MSGPLYRGQLANPFSQKIRRYQHQQWVPGQTSKLVQDYNVFQDELRALSNLFKRRVKFFKHLAKDVEAHAEEDKKSDRGEQNSV